MKKVKLLLLSLFIILSLSTGLKAEYFSDVIITGTSGLWTDSRSYSTINAAVTAIGTDKRTLLITSPQSVTSLTIPSNITLRFERDGSITNSGQLTIQTKNIIADDHQIFTGTGDIDFAQGTEVKSSWFSNLYTAITLTSDDTITLNITKQETLHTSCALGNNVTLKWNSQLLIGTATGITFSNIGHVEAGHYQIFSGAGKFTFIDGVSLNLKWFAHLRSAITHINTNLATLIIDSSHTIDYSDTVPSNINLKFLKGGLFVQGAAYTLTINGTLESNNSQIFSGFAAGEIVGLSYVNGKWFGMKGDGSTDDSAAFAVAWSAATYFNDTWTSGQSFAGARISAGLYLPSGVYLITANNFLNSTGGQAGLNGWKYIIRGDGEGSTAIIFKPTVANAYMYDQTQAGAPALSGFMMRDLRIEFDDSDNGGTAIHGFRCHSAAGSATQRFRFENFSFYGHEDTVFMRQEGTVNEDLNKWTNCYFYKLKTLLDIQNAESVGHTFVNVDVSSLFGHMIVAKLAGTTSWFGGTVTFDATAADECSLIHLGGVEAGSSHTDATYIFVGIRAEFRAAKSRALYISENNIPVPITFLNCTLTKVDSNQNFAKVTVGSNARITFDSCVLPSSVSGSKFEFVDNPAGTPSGTRSLLRFVNCMAGASTATATYWADFSSLSTASDAQYQIVEYIGCLGTPDTKHLQVDDQGSYGLYLARLLQADANIYPLLIRNKTYSASDTKAVGLYQSDTGSGILVNLGAGSLYLDAYGTANTSDVIMRAEDQIQFQDYNGGSPITRGYIDVKTGSIKLTGLPTYTDNMAALTGGLVAGQFYRTASGVVMVTYTP
jgi:hypothetical protein